MYLSDFATQLKGTVPLVLQCFRWSGESPTDIALAIARGLDVAQDEGLPVDQLGFAECSARELVALWFADKTGDADTADYLRETSMSTWGVPKGLWLEAKECRKLTGSK